MTADNDAPSFTVTDTTAARFRADVMEPSLRRPVLVEFWSPSSAACRKLSPVLERVVQAAQGRAALVRMNVEAEPDIAAQLGVASVPAVVAFQRGRPMDGFVGAPPDAQVRGFLERLVGPIEDAADALAEAEALVAAGDLEAAEAALAELVAKEPPQPKAIALFAGVLVAAGRLDDARALLDPLPESLRKDPAIAGALAALENAARAEGLGEIDDLRQRAASDPDDLQARFDLAIALNARDLREEAADALLDIIRRDRSWNEDGARKQLVQFFEAWGPMDKAAVGARRKLSTLLFS